MMYRSRWLSSKFGKSLHALRSEKAELEADLEATCMSLARRGIRPGQRMREIKPLTIRLVALEQRIRDKTPWRELVASRDEITNLILQPRGVTAAQLASLRSELARLEFYLTYTSWRKPVTFKTLLILTVLVLAAVYLPSLIVDWLLP